MVQTLTPEAFVRANTRLTSPPQVPEIRLHVAEEAFGLWAKTEKFLGRRQLAPPFWAFAWAGGQALARYVLDHSDLVRGRMVLDLATGSGLVAIAAARAGAARVTATDIDGLALAAFNLNAEANGVQPAGVLKDVLDGEAYPAEVVLAGDVFYEKSMADRVLGFLIRAQSSGAVVLVGDPNRAYLPRPSFELLATYRVDVTPALEDSLVKPTTVWRLGGLDRRDRVSERAEPASVRTWPQLLSGAAPRISIRPPAQETGQVPEPPVVDVSHRDLGHELGRKLRPALSGAVSPPGLDRLAGLPAARGHGEQSGGLSPRQRIC
jgi:predicted nicotinamide N-methyase